jgi:hypothetical protein
MPKTALARVRELAVPAEVIDRCIYLIRGQKVMLDADIARLYKVLTKNLNLAVRATWTDFLKISCSSSRRKRLKV